MQLRACYNYVNEVVNSVARNVGRHEPVFKKHKESNMIIYEATKREFVDAVLNQTIIDTLVENYTIKIGKVKESERRAWNNSLMFMYQVLEDHGIPNDMGVALEYKIPYTNNRIDVILTGYMEENANSAVVIELKQWSQVEQAKDKVGYVVTVLGGGKVATEHPSYQAWSYAYMLENYNEAVEENQFSIQPCAFLHNYSLLDNDVLLDQKYEKFVHDAPIFAKGDIRKLREFIKHNIHYGDNKEGLYTIENGRISPSKALQDALSGMLQGNQEFVLLDRQYSVFEKGIYMAGQSRADNQKRVLIVKGGPGTGKSVVAVNLLVKLMTHNEVNKVPLNVVYVTKNNNPRYVYMKKLQGEYTKSYIKNLFKGAGAFVDVEENTYDAIICDEAHRLMKNGGSYNQRAENQVRSVIKSARCSIFFIDEYQKICLDDYGTIERIQEEAIRAGAEVEVMELQSQFRCNGSDGYLKWVENVLGMEENANLDDMGMDYDFRVMDSPNEMFALVERQNKINDKSRVVAGYCWEWDKATRNNRNVHDIIIEQFGFERSWNIPTGTWAIDKGSINEIGCIHTCQGLEFDYVGVIIGDDLRYENGKIICDADKRAKTDHSLNGLKKMMRENPKKGREEAIQIIKNTYRVLMSRGMKGCYVYCTDKALSDYLKMRLQRCQRNDLYVRDVDAVIEFNQ